MVSNGAPSKLLYPEPSCGAADALAPVLAIPPEQRLDPVTRRMREVGRALVEPRLRGSSAARALHGHVEDFCAVSFPAQLPT
jgi:hypothetical protein